MEKSRFFKWAAIALVCGAITYPWYLSATGYCFEQEKYLTDEEYIAIAVRHNAYNMKIDQPEGAIKNFYAKNPGCCSVNRSSHMASSWWENLLGSHYVEVEINYEKNSKNLTKEDKNFYKDYTTIKSCGDVGGSMGEDTSTLEFARKRLKK